MTKKEIDERPFDSPIPPPTGYQYWMDFEKGNIQIQHDIRTGALEVPFEPVSTQILLGFVKHSFEEELKPSKPSSSDFKTTNSLTIWSFVFTSSSFLILLILILLVTCTLRFCITRRLQIRPKSNLGKNALSSGINRNARTLLRHLAVLTFSILTVASTALWLPLDCFLFDFMISNNTWDPWFYIFVDYGSIVFETTLSEPASPSTTSNTVEYNNFAFSYGCFTDTFDPDVTLYDLLISVELWVLSVLFGIYPIVAFYRGPLRRHLRRKKGCCLTCGYDARGNAGNMCPECGSLPT